MLHAIWAMPSWFVGACGLGIVAAVLVARWGIRLAREDEWIDAEPELADWQHDGWDYEREAAGPGTGPLRVAGSSGWRGRFDSDSPRLRSGFPGPDLHQRAEPLRAGEPHDAWDAWWAGLDGLTRECWEVTRLVEREREAWAVLVAETRELCGLAA